MEAGSIPVDYGSNEHMQQVWEWASQHKFWSSVGAEAKSGRWFQVARKWENYRQHAELLRLIVQYIALHLRWWKSFETSPFAPANVLANPEGAAGSDDDPDEAAVDDNDIEPDAAANVGVRERRVAGAGNAPAAPDTVLGSNVGAAAPGNKNGLYLVGQILGRRTSPTLMTLTSAVAGPVMAEHGHALTAMKTKRGCKEWHKEMAAGERVSYLVETCKQLVDVQLLRQCFLIQGQGAGVPAFPLNVVNKIVSGIVDFLRELLWREVLTVALYCRQLPSRCFGLLHHSEDVRRPIIEQVLGLYTRLLELENKSADDPWVKSFLGKMLWPLGVWPRELCVMLRETDGFAVSETMMADLADVASGPGGTKDIEDTFNVLRRSSKAHVAEKLGPCQGWHRATMSQVLEDAGKLQPQVAAEDVVSAPETMRNGVFTLPPASECTLGNDTVQRLLGKQDWPSLAPQGYMESVLHTEALRTIGPEV